MFVVIVLDEILVAHARLLLHQNCRLYDFSETSSVRIAGFERHCRLFRDFSASVLAISTMLPILCQNLRVASSSTRLSQCQLELASPIRTCPSYGPRSDANAYVISSTMAGACGVSRALTRLLLIGQGPNFYNDILVTDEVSGGDRQSIQLLSRPHNRYTFGTLEDPALDSAFYGPTRRCRLQMRTMFGSVADQVISALGIAKSKAPTSDHVWILLLSA